MSDINPSLSSDSDCSTPGAPKGNRSPCRPWFFLASVVISFFAGMQLGVYHGGFRGDVFHAGDSSALAFHPVRSSGGEVASSVEKPVLSLAEEGKSVYANCVPCHQANGGGVVGQFPSLVGADWVVGSERRLVALLLKGVQGPLKVGDAVYNGAMPAWEKSLSDRKVASVASYVRSAWGNSASEVTEAVVSAVKKEVASREAPWTEADLMALSGDPVSVAASGGLGSAGAEAGSRAPVANQLPVGRDTYGAVCSACHQATGKGLPPLFPSLEATDYVLGSKDRLIAIVLKGIAGPISVKGVSYNGVMPAQESVLSDEKISSVLSFVRSSFGNSADGVSAEEVSAVRRRFAGRQSAWSESELLNFSEQK